MDLLKWHLEVQFRSAVYLGDSHYMTGGTSRAGRHRNDWFFRLEQELNSFKIWNSWLSRLILPTLTFLKPGWSQCKLFLWRGPSCKDPGFELSGPGPTKPNPTIKPTNPTQPTKTNPFLFVFSSFGPRTDDASMQLALSCANGLSEQATKVLRPGFRGSPKRFVFDVSFLVEGVFSWASSSKEVSRMIVRWPRCFENKFALLIFCKSLGIKRPFGCQVAAAFESGATEGAGSGCIWVQGLGFWEVTNGRGALNF